MLHIAFDRCASRQIDDHAERPYRLDVLNQVRSYTYYHKGRIVDMTFGHIRRDCYTWVADPVRNWLSLVANGDEGDKLCVRSGGPFEGVMSAIGNNICHGVRRSSS